jgi:hypothetical protein
MRLSISEILQQVEAAPSREEKLRILKWWEADALKEVLKYAFHPDLTFLLPDGDCPYTPMPTGEGHGMLYTESRKLYLFAAFQGQPLHPTLKPAKRQLLFIQFLEGIDPQDAKLMVAIKDKQMPYKSVTPDLVLEAFPGLFPMEVPQGALAPDEAPAKPKRKRKEKTGPVA